MLIAICPALIVAIVPAIITKVLPIPSAVENISLKASKTPIPAVFAKVNLVIIDETLSTILVTKFNIGIKIISISG